MDPKPATIEEYLAPFPDHVRALLEEVREKIRIAVPEAEESISYGIPAFFLQGVLVYYAGYKKHISVYPAPREHPLFKDELAAYKGGKGTVQFPLDQPIPFELILRIVDLRLQENLSKPPKKKK